MAYDYASVHLKYTIPLAVLLTSLAYRIFNRIHVLNIAALAVIAFTATLPWDSYLIKSAVWSYPPGVIIGPKLFGIPIEELFFFVIQTYITSVIYIIFNKPLLHVKHLKNQRDPPRWMHRAKRAGQLFLTTLTLYGAYLVELGGKYTYMGLILIWASPFALITWTMAGLFIMSLPLICTTFPILIPTVYLWLVDELALGRGTWSIESGTKLGLCLFGRLEVEEALFFLATNILIVFGMATFDQYLAVIYAFPHLFPEIPQLPTPLMLLQGRFTGTSRYDMKRIHGICEAVERLQAMSQSFYLASAAFSGRLRIDLILLYSFCRVADDLVDNSTTEPEVRMWAYKLTRYLDYLYHRIPQKDYPVLVPRRDVDRTRLNSFVESHFPASAGSALMLLPTSILPAIPLYLLVDGFRMDSKFNKPKGSKDRYFIKDEVDLYNYSRRVAGTVGELCVALVIHHCRCDIPSDHLTELQIASREMGIALQYVNIARDVADDAKIGRVYLPTEWLKEDKLTPSMVIQRPRCAAVMRVKARVLEMAFCQYEEAKSAMKLLPNGARGPMVFAVESYMEIGRVLREVNTSQPTKLSTRRRISVAVRAALDA